MVKLQNRWQDTLFNFQGRIKLLKKIQREQRKLARQRAHAARKSMMKRSVRYSLFVKNMHGKVGKGRINLLSHYNAKKRVYARRKKARKLSGSRTLMDSWKSKYSLEGSGWGWMGTKPLNKNSINITTWKGITLTEPTQQSWFDSEGYPLTSRDPETGRFVNPWLSESTNGKNGLKKFLRWKLGGAWSRVLNVVGVPSANPICENVNRETKGKTPDIGNSMKEGINKASARTVPFQIPMPQAQPSPPSAGSDIFTRDKSSQSSSIDSQIAQESISLTWIGHSSTMVTFPGDFTILTDPHFSNYAGPVRRTAPPAFGVADLPEVVDCVLISHDHMDHLDYWSILELIESNKVKFWIAPLGIKSWLMDRAGVSPENIVELEWWEGVRISKTPKGKQLNKNKSEIIWPEVDELVQQFDKITGKRDNSRKENACGSSDKNELVVTCAPAQHWCSRTPFDRNRRLWCSFAIHATPAISQPTSQTHSFYFAGDTGLPSEFPLHHQIGDRLGPFDLSAIPIGAYEPEWFMRESHCNPAEAVKIHQSVRSRRSVGIHFDTFDLADEPREEPPTKLSDEVVRVNEEIVKMAAEVTAVADKVGIPTGMEKIEGQFGKDAKQRCKANEQLIEMLPPLVDFSVIKQGQSIESLPK